MAILILTIKKKEDKTMKKTLFAISAIAVLLGFTACTSENEILEPQVSGKTILKAYTEEATRTTLSGNDKDGYKVVWSEGDKITVGDKTFTLKEEDGGAGTTSGTFTGDALTDDTEYTAYYPADYDGENWPTAQTYTAGNITGSPMKATFKYTKDVEPSLKFQNEGGILRLNLKLEEGADERSVSKVVVSSTQLDKDIELNCETAVALTEEGVPFHIAVPAKEYSNLTFTIYDTEGYKCTKSLKSSNTLTVERSEITTVNLSAKFCNYLCFTAGEAGAKIGMNKGSVRPNIEYSTDLTTWNDFTIGNTTVTLANVGDKVYFRGDNPEGFNKGATNFVEFTTKNGTVAASGNVMSLIDPTCQATTIPCNYCFSRLFYNCTGLTTAPALPATTLTASCYYQMFYKCTSLTAAPELPATTLATSCYNQMFYGCKSLNSVTCLATNIPTLTCVSNWLKGVATPGTFTKAASMTSWTTKSTSGIPTGWTVVDYVPATTGKATATIGGSDVDVKWIQLWENGPKFAEYNVADKMSFEDAAKTGADYVWGANWRTPSKDELNELVKAASSAGSEKVTCVYGQVSGNWGFTFTSKEEAYTGNSVFFPASGSDFMGAENYWSSSEENENGYKMRLFYDSDGFDGKCLMDSKFSSYLVRPVLAK